MGVLAVGLGSIGGESPEKAIYALAHDVEHRDAAGVCGLLFPSTYLPAAVARKLQVPDPGPPGQGTWESSRRECDRDFGKRAEFDSFDFLDPRVHRTEMVRVEAAGGITRAALASVALHGGRPQPVKLVEYRGSWKIVFEVN